MTEPSEMAQMYFFSPDAFPTEGRQAIAFVSSAFAIDVFPAEGGNPDRSRVFPDQKDGFSAEGNNLGRMAG